MDNCEISIYDVDAEVKRIIEISTEERFTVCSNENDILEIMKFHLVIPNRKLGGLFSI